MKKYLFGAAAALAIAAPGVASAQSGYVDVGYNTTEGEVLGFETEADGWQFGGAAAWGGQGFGFQLDGLFSSVEGDAGGDVDAYNLGGHLFMRNDVFLAGGFLNFGNIDAGGVDSDYWTIGAEGQWYLSRLTLDGAISYSESDDAELLAFDFGGSYFFTDNFSAGANLGFGTIEGGGGGDADVSAFGLGAEYQFDTFPLSIFGGWQHSEVDDIDADADTLGIGVRWNWGGTLFNRNRNGASLSRGGGLGRYAGIL